MKTLRILYTALLLPLALTQGAFCQNHEDLQTAQETKPLVITSDKAVELALTNNISLKQSKITLDAAKRSYNHSWNSVSPSISAGGSISTPNTNFANQYSANFNAKINFNLSVSLVSQIKAAKTAWQNGLLSYDDACRQVELTVRTSFFKLLYEKESVKLLESSLNTAYKQYQQTSNMYKMGSISQLDVLSSQVNYEQTKPRLEAQQISYDNSLAVFKNILGIPQETEIELADSLESDYSGVDVNPQIDIENIPAINLSKKNLENTKANLLNAQLSNWTPAISAGWNYSPSFSSVTQKTNDSGALSLSITLPLDSYLPWTKTADTIAAAKDSVKKAELQLQKDKQDAAVEIQTALNQIKKSQNTLSALKQNVTLAQKSFDMTSIAYSRGGKDYLSLVNAQYNLDNAKTSLYQERFTLISAVLDLEYTLGLPFGSLLNMQSQTQASSNTNN